jgi:hypothetical protein
VFMRLSAMHIRNARRNAEFSLRYRCECGDAVTNHLFAGLRESQSYAALANVRVGHPFRAGINRDARLQRRLG